MAQNSVKLSQAHALLDDAAEAGIDLGQITNVITAIIAVVKSPSIASVLGLLKAIGDILSGIPAPAGN